MINPHTSSDSDPKREAIVAAAILVRGKVLRWLQGKVGEADAEDVWGETVCAALKGYSKLEGDDAAAFIWGVGRNRMKEFRRRRAREAARLAGSVEVDGQAAEPRTGAATREIRTKARAIFETLPQRDQDIIRLCRWEGLSSGEVADMLGMQPGAVRVRLLRAGKLIAMKATKQGVEP